MLNAISFMAKRAARIYLKTLISVFKGGFGRNYKKWGCQIAEEVKAGVGFL